MHTDLVRFPFNSEPYPCSVTLLYGALETGLIYGLVPSEIYLSFRVLDFPDLPVAAASAFGAACGRHADYCRWNLAGNRCPRYCPAWRRSVALLKR